MAGTLRESDKPFYPEGLKPYEAYPDLEALEEDMARLNLSDSDKHRARVEYTSRPTRTQRVSGEVT